MVEVFCAALSGTTLGTEALERCHEITIDWVAEIWLHNLVTMLIVAGGLHLYFFTFRCQQNTEKYDPRDLLRNSKLFFFNNQVWDNMFLTLVSAVGIWSCTNPSSCGPMPMA